MDKTAYLQEAERQLSDCRFYEKLDSHPKLDFTQKIKRALQAMHVRGHIDDKTMEYITPEYPKPGRCYLLPKMHKENIRICLRGMGVLNEKWQNSKSAIRIR